MAATLKTDYKDFIPPETGKKYKITTDSLGFSTIEDVTDYTQTGDTFGASDINTTNSTINELKEMHQTITANERFKSVAVQVARIGNIVTITAPVIVNYEKGEGGYPVMLTLPAGYRPSTTVDILLPTSGEGDAANVMINSASGNVEVGLLGNSATVNLRINFSYVI